MNVDVLLVSLLPPFDQLMSFMSSHARYREFNRSTRSGTSAQATPGRDGRRQGKSSSTQHEGGREATKEEGRFGLALSLFTSTCVTPNLGLTVFKTHHGAWPTADLMSARAQPSHEDEKAIWQPDEFKAASGVVVKSEGDDRAIPKLGLFQLEGFHDLFAVSLSPSASQGSMRSFRGKDCKLRTRI